MTARDWLDEHRTELDSALDLLHRHAATVEEWGRELAHRLPAGARLLAAGNGGSAAEAQHLTSELVGRFLHDRRAFSAISLCAESSSLSAIVNDYGAEEMFARQVEGHGRPGDVLVLLSTSGTSPNVLRAAARGRALGLTVWGLTGPAPNPLAALCHDALSITAPSTAAVQEGHLVAVHALCAAVDRHLGVTPAPPQPGSRPAEPTGGAAVGGATGRPRQAPREGDSRPHVVVGDVLLDADVEGVVDRLCPDAPAPVLDVRATRHSPGGAGLAA
ncbi:SIS domain-containing protein, partial [uncultured Georgenia sp.]|uniref:D-sedoheptulose-7-phosphate isomerase n=1 Tax=uncultured Georgenia sp. TaxID=378209 RepID=UPI002606C90B